MCLITVIIPNYNHSNFIKQRIDSVLNQTFQDFDLIILDDCSSDNSKEIIEMYRKHKKVSNIIYNNSNSNSVFKQLAKGIELAKGEYIWIAESDDFADSRFLEIMIRHFKSNPSAGVSYTDSNLLDENFNLTKSFYKKYRSNIFNTNRWDYFYINSGYNEVNTYLIYDCTINNMSAFLFRRDLVSKHDLYMIQQFKYSGDWLFYLLLVSKTNIIYEPTPLNTIRRTSSNFKSSVQTHQNHFLERTLVRYIYFKQNVNFVKNHFKVILKINKEFLQLTKLIIKNRLSWLPILNGLLILCKLYRFYFLSKIPLTFNFRCPRKY